MFASFSMVLYINAELAELVLIALHSHDDVLLCVHLCMCAFYALS